jgi:hypothetical protein
VPEKINANKVFPSEILDVLIASMDVYSENTIFQWLVRNPTKWGMAFKDKR